MSIQSQNSFDILYKLAGELKTAETSAKPQRKNVDQEQVVKGIYIRTIEKGNSTELRVEYKGTGILSKINHFIERVRNRASFVLTNKSTKNDESTKTAKLLKNLHECTPEKFIQDTLKSNTFRQLSTEDQKSALKDIKDTCVKLNKILKSVEDKKVRGKSASQTIHKLFAEIRLPDLKSAKLPEETSRLAEAPHHQRRSTQEKPEGTKEKPSRADAFDKKTPAPSHRATVSHKKTEERSEAPLRAKRASASPKMTETEDKALRPRTHATKEAKSEIPAKRAYVAIAATPTAEEKLAAATSALESVGKDLETAHGHVKQAEFHQPTSIREAHNMVATLKREQQDLAKEFAIAKANYVAAEKPSGHKDILAGIEKKQAKYERATERLTYKLEVEGTHSAGVPDFKAALLSKETPTSDLRDAFLGMEDKIAGMQARFKAIGKQTPISKSDALIVKHGMEKITKEFEDIKGKYDARLKAQTEPKLRKEFDQKVPILQKQYNKLERTHDHLLSTSSKSAGTAERMPQEDSGDTEEDVSVKTDTLAKTFAKDVIATTTKESAHVPSEKELAARFSKSSDEDLSDFVNMRGQQVVVLRKALDSPLLHDWTPAQKTHAKEKLNTLISEGSKLDPTAQNVAKLEHAFQAGVDSLMKRGLSDDAKVSLREAIQDVVPNVLKELGHEQLLALEAPKRKGVKSEESETKVTEHPGIIETTTVEKEHRFVVAKNSAVESRNALLAAFANADPLEGGYLAGPWDQLSDESSSLLSNIAEDTDNNIQQLSIDHDLIKESMDEGLSAAGYTTISEVEDGQMPNWPTELRDAFVSYETKMREINNMISEGEKALPAQSSRLPRRTTSQIFKRSEMPETTQTRSKDAESPELVNKQELKEFRKDVRTHKAAKEAAERAVKNKEIGLATKAVLIARKDFTSARNALREALAAMPKGPKGWIFGAVNPFEALTKEEKAEWNKGTTFEKRMKLIEKGLKNSGWGSVEAVRKAAVENYDLFPFLSALAAYDTTDKALFKAQRALNTARKE